MDAHLAASGICITDDAHLARVLYRLDCADVLIVNGEPVGLLKVLRSPEAWEIVQFQLSSCIQGQGFGSAVLKELLADAARARVGVRLSVLKTNPARKLYERLGFQLVGEDMHEYFMHRAAPCGDGGEVSTPK